MSCIALKVRQGFTLLEVLLSVAILGLVATITAMSFTSAITAWNRAVALSENLHHSDYVLDQLVMALRSAYFPDGGAVGAEYGFHHEDNGDGPLARDAISWVKLGSALIEPDAMYAESAHRIRFFVDDHDGGGSAAWVAAWQLMGQQDGFDPDTLEPVAVSRRVVGLDVRSAFERDSEDQIDWLDVWEETNKVPRVISLTLYLEPLVDGEDPMPMHRIVRIPAGGLSWNR